MNLKESVHCAKYVVSRVRYSKPAEVRLQDYVDTLVAEGMRLWRAGARNEQSRFDTTMLPIDCGTATRNTVIRELPRDMENIAQFTSHLILLALDARKGHNHES